MLGSTVENPERFSNLTAKSMLESTRPWETDRIFVTFNDIPSDRLGGIDKEPVATHVVSGKTRVGSVPERHCQTCTCIPSNEFAFGSRPPSYF